MAFQPQLRVQGLGFRVQGLGRLGFRFRVEGLGFRVGFRVKTFVNFGAVGFGEDSTMAK